MVAIALVASVGTIAALSDERDAASADAGVADDGTSAAEVDGGAGADPEAPPASTDAAGRPATEPLARSGRLGLWLPAASPVVVGYHEAAHATAIGMTPVGTPVDDRNTTRTDLPAADAAGPDYLVLTSRGRSAGPTSAVDIVLPEGVEVLSPATGTVLDVRTYELYGAHEDVRIEIAPDDRPDLRLVLIHVDGARVTVGDRVEAGVTPVAATARRFPFSSHIDRETEPERFPHVHLELQPIDAPRPGDDAADPDDAAAREQGQNEGR